MTKLIPLVRVSPIILFVDFLEELGTPTETLLKQCKIPIFALENPNSFISCYQAFNFVHHTAHREGIDNLGILVAEKTNLDSLGILGRLVCNSVTLYNAILTAIYAGNLFNSCERFWLVEQGDTAYFCQQYINTKDLVLDHTCHFCLRMMLNLIQTVAGKHWYPQKISLQTKFSNFTDHPLSEVKINRDVAINSIEFPRSFLSLPLPSLSSNSYSPEVDYVHLHETAPPTNFSQCLELAITPLLKEGYPNINIASEIAKMSIRNLQRTLTKEGLSYSQLITRIRYKTAVDLLQDLTLKIIDIAYELGYEDPAHFTRAFKRWTGLSPNTFRHQSQI
ncbi:helix-turn-helix domain-containing protein [Geminocystis sp. GBBB08]|uniref:AraC family transcriptional regulator n=1 Tax=Geminocystis sp. GBBB08 TaxID=2604140 RepID=UPI0027E22E0F|nr:helix-turn-helix domain-containing protein [Geminocystis sp. GBBB08]MBL1209740.1 AraC family transcriptional regulator [Geminocystis sp. GBBB08]